MKRIAIIILILLAFSGCITVRTGPHDTETKQMPEILEFNIDPANISAGQTATITWAVLGASSAYIEPGIGTVDIKGMTTVSPTETTSYVISAENEYGTSKQTITLNVGTGSTSPGGTSTGSRPVVLSFTASPSTISSGGFSVLNWNVTGATDVKISGIGVVNSSGSSTIYPTTTTSYTLDAQNSAGTTSATTLVTVGSTIPPIPGGSRPVISLFTANPSVVAPGATVELNWIISNATSVSLDHGLGSVAAISSRLVYPTTSTTYTITAQNSSGMTSATTAVTVSSTPAGGGRPGVISFTTNPSTTTPGGTVELSWNIYNATSVVLDPGFGGVAPVSSILVYPMTTTTYTLTAQNSAGTTFATQTVTVTGSAFPSGGPPIIDHFYAVPNHIYEGESTMLKWGASNAVRFTIYEPMVTGFTAETTANDMVVSPVVSGYVTRGADMEYILTAYSASGDSTEARTILHVEVPVPEYTPTLNYFYADPPSIHAGDATWLYWDVSNADSVTIDPSVGSVALSGSRKVFPTGYTVYTLYATNGRGTSSIALDVSVSP